MKQAILFCFTILLSVSAIAQTIVRGNVKDANGEEIIGANIYLEGTYDGTTSGVDGSFEFTTYETGEMILIVSFIGYENFKKPLLLYGKEYLFKIILKESINQMKTLVITAGTFEASDESKNEVLRPLDIVTTAGATADIAGALNTLPGTQTVGEEGRLFVRGGDAYETTTFIDGMLVVDSYERSIPNVPTRNRFSPMMFKGASFSTGGYSAEYGQGLSSALILNTKDVAVQNRSDFSIMSVGLEAAHTQTFRDASLTAKLGYINLSPYYNLVKQNVDWTTEPTALDGNLSYRQKVRNNGLLKMYGKFNFSEMAVNYYPVDSSGYSPVQINNDYGHLTISYADILKDGLTMKSGLSYTRTVDDIINENEIINQSHYSYHAKLTFGYDLTKNVVLNFGGEYFNHDNTQDYHNQVGNSNNVFHYNESIYSTFLESDLYLSQKLLARIGGRVEHNTLSNTSSLDPRFSMAYKTGEQSQFSIAYGIFRQSAPPNLLRIANSLASEKAEHFILSYQASVNNRIFRIEAYRKNYSDLVKFDPLRQYQPSAYSNEGSGYARGIDLFWRDNESIPNADYWVSYSFLDTERDYRDNPVMAVPTFASAHNVSVVYKHFVSSIKSQLGLTYTYASGRPYNDPNIQDYNSERTKNYHDLSANVSYLMRQNMILYVSVTNVTGRENIFGYEYQNSPDADGIYDRRSVTLPAPRFLFVGFFITLSKDGTMNRLPNL